MMCAWYLGNNEGMDRGWNALGKAVDDSCSTCVVSC
jgi:hypothetical protein